MGGVACTHLVHEGPKKKEKERNSREGEKLALVIPLSTRARHLEVAGAYTDYFYTLLREPIWWPYLPPMTLIAFRG